MAVPDHSSPTWTATIPDALPKVEIVGAATFLLYTPPCGLAVHVVHASIIGTHPRKAEEAVYRAIKGPTCHFMNHCALKLVVERLR